mmetsp:Transcript_5588/g.14141  ORF Transcript_5588/g.14141 Transcript_5588/m.14141 type:complete len:201 (+) Transcript_5588:858-1460(+)
MRWIDTILPDCVKDNGRISSRGEMVKRLPWSVPNHSKPSCASTALMRESSATSTQDTRRRRARFTRITTWRPAKMISSRPFAHMTDTSVGFPAFSFFFLVCSNLASPLSRLSRKNLGLMASSFCRFGAKLLSESFRSIKRRILESFSWQMRPVRGQFIHTASCVMITGETVSFTACQYATTVRSVLHTMHTNPSSEKHQT